MRSRKRSSSLRGSISMPVPLTPRLCAFTCAVPAQVVSHRISDMLEQLPPINRRLPEPPILNAHDLLVRSRVAGQPEQTKPEGVRRAIPLEHVVEVPTGHVHEVVGLRVLSPRDIDA